MSVRTKWLMVAAAGLAVIGLGASWWLWGRAPALSPQPLANVPEHASAVGYVRVGSVIESELWERFVTQRGADEGMRRIEKECGFNPLTQIEDLVVFVAGEQPQSLEHVGVVGRGPFEHRELARCVGKVVEREGGEVREVNIDGTRAIAGSDGDSRAAFVGRDGLAIGNEEIVEEIIAVVRHESGSAREHDSFRRLWKRVARLNGAEGDSDVVIVGRLPDHWRAAIRRYLGDTWDGALRPVEALGLSADVDSGLDLGLTLEMSEEQAADAFVAQLRDVVEKLRSRPTLQLTALGPALHGLQMDAAQDLAMVTLSLDISQIAALVSLVQERLLQRDTRGNNSDQPRTGADPVPLPSPDEVIRRSEEE